MAEPATYMMFLNCDGEHFDQFVLPAEVATSLALTTERLSSWAIDTRGYASCLVTPNKDEDGNTYFELDCVDQQGTRFNLIAACFKATTQ